MKQKEPFLRGISTLLDGGRRRSTQAAIALFRQKAVRQSISGYARLFDFILPADFLLDIDSTKRRSKFDLITVLWAWIAQVLDSNASCSKAVAMIQSWNAQAGLPIPRSDTSSYCQARQRLPESMLEAVDKRIKASLERSIRSDDRWHGFVLKAFDGSSVQLCDTPENQVEFPQPGSQKAGCGFPVMSIMGVLNLSHGGWEGMITAENNIHDARLAQQALALVESRDLVLADRAFCSYELISRIKQRGAEVVMRLHQARHRKLDWRRGRKVSPLERLVTWAKPTHQPGSSDLSAEQWEALPEELTLRYIKIGYEDRSGEKRMLVVVSTLLDPKKHSALEVSELYTKRWEIELKFRDLKTVLGLEFVAVKTPAMARKSARIMVIAYNLIRSLMQRSAHHAGQPLWQMSFKGSLDLAISMQSLFLGPAHHRRKRQLRLECLIEIGATKLVNIRPYRQEPRALKRRPKPFQLLAAPRHIFREIPHKSTYKKAA